MEYIETNAEVIYANRPMKVLNPQKDTIKL
jgi:hypothetical protein